jgi:hypothetical protein
LRQLLVAAMKPPSFASNTLLIIGLSLLRWLLQR